MAAPTLEMEPVEPQSLKKLSLKSLKRALDLFSPIHGQFAAPDPERQANSGAADTGNQGSVPSNALALTAVNGAGPADSRDSQKGGAQNALVVGPSLQPKGQNDVGTSGKSSAITSASAPFSERCELSKSKDSLGPVENTSVNKDPARKDTDKNIHDCSDRSRYYSKADNLVGVKDIWNFIFDDTFLADNLCYSRKDPKQMATSRVASSMEELQGESLFLYVMVVDRNVISGHLGWVRSVAFDPSNNWFCTGSADRTIKIWDVASGRLKLTLTGHIEQIRGLAVSSKHTYMFSAGDDKQVKCWDLEQNKVIRSYHGHLSGVYCLALHPTIDILLTGGRDSVCRVWDIRTKMQIFALSGHDNTVCSVFTRPTDPQIVTGSHDTTIKFWDLRYGKTMSTLTHHKKSVRAMAPHPKEHSFASASADNIKKFSLPKGEFLHNMLSSQQKTIINTMAVNEDGVMATGGDNGSLWFWDWRSGHNFQQAQTIVQPGSLDSEAGIYALAYDVTGTRLISCEADKTIKMWKEDETATEQTHPLNFKPPKDIRRF
ncbi:hypothetical protein Godav_013149 [Gossypium davidsonii]|uniref:Uncharacterized protein n=1 Tax=Gossypium davidsonii TaxID=34287 RepID=A0A7J8RFH7_GOSDV|nr:hypothetical protein [Gossypium davidsonii]